MYCEVFYNIQGTDDLLFVEAGVRRFAYLEPPIQQRFRYWQTVELNALKRPSALIDFQVTVIYEILEHGHCIIGMPAEWIQRWKVEFNDIPEHDDGRPHNNTERRDDIIEVLPPEHKRVEAPVWA